MQRGSQKVSKIACGIVTVAWTTAVVCFFIALHNHHWLWLLSIFTYVIGFHLLLLLNFDALWFMEALFWNLFFFLSDFC